MYCPELLYGVNLENIPEERRNLPEEIKIIGDSGEFYRIDLDLIDELVRKEGLSTLINEGLLGMGDEGHEPEEIHVGVYIENDYVNGTKVEGRTRALNELIRFEIDQIIRLRQNPSELIKKLKKIGLDVKPEELALYGGGGVD